MNENKSKKTIYKIRRHFLSGVVIWVPIIITIIVIKFLLDIFDKTLVFLPESYHIPGLGLILSIVIILLTGLLAANFVGAMVVSLWDAFIARIPFVSSIHSGVKDILKVFVKPEGKSFKKVYLVEFPRKGMWTVAFQTGEGTKEIQKGLVGGQLISLYVPTTPNITSGFVVMVTTDEVIALDMSIDQALAFVISLGVMKPEGNEEKKE